VTAGWAALVAIVGASVPTQEVRFIACPIYRDTDAGRKSGCWLADETATGVRYDITSAPSKPDWNHAVLVEGSVAQTTANPCGGAMLDPVRVSVLEESCTRHMIPAEGFPGRKFGLPTRNVRPLFEPRAPVPAPYSSRTFTLVFDFDSAFMVYQLDDWLLDQAITYIRAAKPREIVVTGYADTTPSTISGRRIAERGGIAAERAANVRTSLIRLGVPPERIRVRTILKATSNDAEGADGLIGPSRRRAEISLKL
jgi:outer membrane protein OmpA-like peptidoglycan-associated protein